MIKKTFKHVLLPFLLLSFILGGTISHAKIFDDAPINASPSAYDFGNVRQDEGIVSTEIVIKNNSDELIQLHRLSTSCGCTSAEMNMEDIKPGESRIMKVSFDPTVHPDQTGPTERAVYLQNSSSISELEINFTMNVIGSKSDTGDTSKNSSTTNNIESSNSKQAIVFFNEACQDCGELVKQFYPSFFEEYGYELIQRDYINDRNNRKILNEFNEKWQVPFELQSHIEAFVGEKLLIGGHVPEPTIRYLLNHPDQYDKLLVYQDKMHGEGTDYKVWNFQDEIKTYSIDEPITTYLNSTHQDDVKFSPSSKTFWGLFGVITVSAFLDGINPCAIAVLLFFIAFLFAIKKTRTSIWKIGLVYIGAIYLAYLLIGIGIAQAILITGSPHLMAYIGSYLVIALGVIQILNVISPKFPIKLRIPINTKAIIEKWLYKSTLPAAFIGGFVVGLCTFPCSGGIYVAIIGMLAASQSYWQGMSWMIWYNLVFVAPLFIILAMAGNKIATEKLQQLERKEARSTKILIGLTMIILGLVIIFFFT